MAEIKAVLFDADNTLYDTRGIASACDREALMALDRKNPKRAIDCFYDAVEELRKSPDPKHRTRQYSYAAVAKKLGLPDDAAASAAARFCELFLSKLKPKPGVKELLSKLRERGIRLGVVTAEEESWALKKLEKSGLRDFFEAVVTANDVGRMKPDPKYFTIACDKMWLKPRDCLVIGDDEDGDLKAARSLGMAAEKPAFALIQLII